MEDIQKESYEEIFKYNSKQNENKIHFKENTFKYFMNKLEGEKDIKTLCKYCISNTILFDYLLNENNGKIYSLTYEDLPREINSEDNFIELIEKYEIIHIYFIKEDEIIKLWERYYNNIIKEKKEDKILNLISIMNKLKSTKNDIYSNFIKNIESDLTTFGKKAIELKKGKELFSFIYDYNKYCDFLSDRYLLEYIGKNIDLNELDMNNFILEEFKKCNLLDIIDINNKHIFIKGVLTNIRGLEDFILFFKYIFPGLNKNEEKKNY